MIEFSAVSAGKLIAGNKFLLALVLLLYGGTAHAYAQTAQAPSPAGRPTVAPRGRVFEFEKHQFLIPDITVFNQRGQRVRLYTDLIKDKVVLLSFFYTNCTAVCPMQGLNLSRLQSHLGGRLGKDVFLISISMDPQTDTPNKLRRWSKAVGARRGWTLVSSNAPEMGKMIAAFTGDYPAPQEMHSSSIFVGNDRTGEWIVSDGLADIEDLVKLLARLQR